MLIKYVNNINMWAKISNNSETCKFCANFFSTNLALAFEYQYLNGIGLFNEILSNIVYQFTCITHHVAPECNRNRGHLVMVIWSFSISGTRLFAHYI